VYIFAMFIEYKKEKEKENDSDKGKGMRNVEKN
jgi:hypothetical protein